MQTIVSTSPDNNHQAVLSYLSEMRFAPSITREFEIEFLELSRWENLQ